MPKPRFESAPGHIVRPYSDGRWEVRWQCRTDLRARGFRPGSVALWTGTEPSAQDRQHISDRCQALQDEMRVWGNGGTPEVKKVFDGTLGGLADCFLTDPDSAYRALRYATKRNMRSILRRLVAALGEDTMLRAINARAIKRAHETYIEEVREKGRAGQVGIAAAHDIIRGFRSLCAFGCTILEDDECARLRGVLSAMRFPVAGRRHAIITAAQVAVLRRDLHAAGLHSIAFATALQFECMCRQKDVIGEWVPGSEPGMSEVTRADGAKWLRGMRWSEIDDNLILCHVTSKKGKELVVDLKLAPMVLEELGMIAGQDVASTNPVTLAVTARRRDALPASGPLIVSEHLRRPYNGSTFRLEWRRIATAAGIPASVWNMDHRAGGISEASDAGADMEKIRHAATHSDMRTTMGYSRNSAGKTADVSRARIAYRKKDEGSCL